MQKEPEPEPIERRPLMKCLRTEHDNYAREPRQCHRDLSRDPERFIRFHDSASSLAAGSAVDSGNGEYYKATMNDSTKRAIFRWIHIVFGIPIIGYVYSPFAELPNYAPVVRFVSIPVLVLTGLWMWKGHLFRRLLSKRSA